MFSKTIHRNIFLFGCLSLPFGMMLGAVPTSVPMFILMGNWLIEGGFKTKWQKIKTSKIFWVLISVFLIHCISLFYSQNFNEGVHDLQMKLPMFVLPVVFFSTPPPSQKEFDLTLYSFIIGSFINISWCLIYSFILHHTETIRDVSRFMSHIRFGLFINMAVCSCIYFFFKQKILLRKLIFFILTIYFIFSLFALGLAAGILNLIFLSVTFFLIIIFKQKLIFKIAASLLLIIGFIITINYINGIYNAHFYGKDIRKTGSQSSQNSQMENGNLVFTNTNNFELKQQWNKRVPADSFNYAPNFYNINKYYVLLRYLTSKGLTKDSIGMSKLSEIDFVNIKNNITNFLYPEWGYLHKRIYELINEYDEFKNHRNINGHSLTMRFYFWKAAFNVIKNNVFIGVGNGDVQQELNNSYIDTKSPLKPEWYKRPHNQFITIALSLGILGLLLFLISLFYPIIYLRRHLNVLYFPFFILLISSFLLEDTLETQAGVSFYVTFNTLFLSFANFKKQPPLGG